MKRVLIACLLAGTAGCSGGGSGTVTGQPVADTTPPVIAITASQTSIQAGESIQLSVSAMDAKDGAITTYTLSCDGGTLTGTTLATSSATPAGTIRCTATARDAAGNTGTGTLAITVAVPTATLSLASSSMTLQAAEWGVILATNLPLASESYEGSIGGKTVTLRRMADGKGLVFITPEGLTPGSNRLQVTISGRLYALDMQVAAPPTISDPRQVVTDYLNSQRSEAVALLNDASVPASVKTRVQQARNDIDTAIGRLASATAEELRLAALSISVNANPLLTQSSAKRASYYDAAGCNRSSNEFLLGVIWTLAAAEVGGTALTAGGLPGLIVGAGAAIGAIAILNKYVVPSIEGIVQHCVSIDEVTVAPAGSSQTGYRAMGAKLQFVQPQSGTLGFRNKQATALRVQRTLGFVEGVAAQIKDSGSRLFSIGQTIGLVPDSLSRLMTLSDGKVVEIVPPGTVSITIGSGGAVTGSYRASGNDLIATFTAVDPETDLINFSLTVASAGNPSVTLPAQLTLALPTAQDGAVTTIQGRGIQSAVSVTGQTSIEVVEQPSRGTLNLLQNGNFSYTPSGNLFGQDSFRYRARNEDGYSRTATVMITVDRQFEGAWQVTLQSVTSSQSSPGLCPNETNVVSVAVNKITDTQYTTSYAGETLNLTMASKDDPAGLSGSKSVTYDDDPGQTSETVNVRIPDSNTLNGSTSWSYSGPNGSSCSGSVTITGRRP